MALPGLVRVTAVAKVLGLDKRTVRAHLMTAGCTPIRRPRASAESADGPWYVTVEDAVRLVDWLLPRVVHRLANQRARRALGKEARLTGSSGPLVTYRGDGTGSGDTPASTATPSPPTKFLAIAVPNDAEKP